MYLDITKFFLTFLIYSFFGYIMEIIICSFNYKKLVNRGFLFGPICPIYGIGATLIIYGLGRYNNNPILIFVLGILITSGVEYYTSYIFEKIFHNKWWDYSDRPDNINGRICLGNSFGFGIGALLIIYVFQPIISMFIDFFPGEFLMIFGTICFIILVIDLISSSIIAYNLRSKLIVAEELKHEKVKMLPGLLEKKYKKQIAKIKFKSNRLIKNYPELAPNLRKELDLIKKMQINFEKNNQRKDNVKKNKKDAKKM
jgi:uncharacterized membrane protein